MLASLIAVILLVVVGFWAVYVGMTGRAAKGEMALSAPKRIGIMVVGLAALGVAYLVYSHPRSFESATRAPKSWNAMPSNPPETRGDAAAQVAAASADPTATTTAAATTLEAAETVEASEASEPPAVAAAEPAQPLATADGAGEVSATAAAMEAELMRRRQRLPDLPGESARAATALADDPPEDETAPATRTSTQRGAVSAGSSAVVASGKPATPSRATSSSRSTRSGAPRRAAPLQPLTIVIYNELGERQERETLSLVIEGKRVARFEITDAAPVIELPINLPRPGLIHYKLEGESIQGRRQRLTGQGCISAVEGARFHVRRKPGSQRVFLESTSG